MQLDSKIKNAIDDAAARLDTRIDILDETGEVVLSSAPDVVGQIDENFENLDFDQPITRNEEGTHTYVRLDSENYRPLRLCIEGGDQDAANYAFLLKQLIQEILKTTLKKPGREEVYRRIMLDRIDPLEMQEAIRDFKIDADGSRCVIIVQTIDGDAASVHQLLAKLFSIKNGDMVVALNRYVVALVKLIEDDNDMESIMEMVKAMDETIENELSINAYLGVGGLKAGLVNIRDSFLEAQEAINLGLMQQNKGRIFMFHRLLLERFLQSVPRDIRKQFYDLAHTDTLRRVLNEEMQSTIIKFFENNLNLSEAARKLYIHRNTLIYRIEKIHRSTGLDLRNFEDAVLLKIIIMLGKSLSSNNRME